MISTGSKKRDSELLRYRTYVWTNSFQHPTFDMERYYTEMSTREMLALRDKTVQDLKRNPDFGTKFYTEFVEYLNRKLGERKTLKDWIWRNTVLRCSLFVWRLGIWLKELKNVQR